METEVINQNSGILKVFSKIGKVILIESIVLLFISEFFYGFALRYHKSRKKRREAGIQGLVKKDLYMMSNDGFRLHAYKIKAKKNIKKYVIICHGYKGSACEMGKIAKVFHDWGYHVLLPDARAHGKSEGYYIGMGWPDRMDLLKWIHYVTGKDPDASLVLYGVSMGAATVMMASGEILPPQVTCVIEDCGYTSVWDEFAVQLKAMFHLPVFPFLHMVSGINKIRRGSTFQEESALNQIAKCKIPVLFIHGTEDTFVPFPMMEKLYSAASCVKEKLAVEGAGHALSRTAAPEIYWKSVEDFLKKYGAGENKETDWSDSCAEGGRLST